MIVYLSDYAHKQLNNLYSDRRFFKTDKEFSDSFKLYNRILLKDLDHFSKGPCPFAIRGRFRFTSLSSVHIYYNVIPMHNAIIISSFRFVGLVRIKKLSTIERREIGKTLRKRPSNIKASTNVNDYTLSNLKGGSIRGVEVKVVKRKGITTMSGKPIFNYLYNGYILSMYDFVNPTPFKYYYGVEKAYADGVNGVRYWVLPTSKRPIKMVESFQQKLKRIITEEINHLLKQCI